MRFRWLRTRHVPCCKWSIAVDALTGCICSEAVWVSLNWPSYSSRCGATQYFIAGFDLPHALLSKCGTKCALLRHPLDRGGQMQSRRKISVFLPFDLFERFNVHCTNQGFKKSPLIARLIREYMERGHNNAVGRRDDESVHATGKR
jgi:hypothetical protein